jgi:hypothetical protein
MTRTRRIVLTAVGIWIALIAIAVQLVAIRESEHVQARQALPAEQSARTLSADVDAAGLQSIDLRATDGAVELIGTDEDRIRISTEISLPTKKRNGLLSFPADLARAELVTERRGEGFIARVRVPGSDRIEERWTVRVPRRFKVDLGANDGSFTVSDVQGGVKIRAKAGLGSKPGMVRVNVPGGPLDLSLSVGELHAQTSSTSRGDVDVESTVGDAKVTLAGREIISPRAPGPGHRLRLTDSGTDSVKLRVSVGTATLDIK